MISSGRAGITAPAKINLALHVRRRRDDGYHDLESVFVFANDGDQLLVEPADALTLQINGAFAAGLSNGNDNLVMRAAHALRNAFDIKEGAALLLEKELPVASGIGGGSADAAAAIHLLTALWNIEINDPRIIDIAKNLGADVPACLISKTLYGDGKGDVLTPVTIPGLSGTPMLLVNPGIALSTAQVFARWDGIDRGPLDQKNPFAGRNDLTDAAISLVPEIDALLDLLRGQRGLKLARMSGSGATCFALFDSHHARDEAWVNIKKAMPIVWCLATEII